MPKWTPIVAVSRSVPLRRCVDPPLVTLLLTTAVLPENKLVEKVYSWKSGNVGKLSTTTSGKSAISWRMGISEEKGKRLALECSERFI